MSSASFPERADAHSPYVILAALSSDESGEFALLEAARTAATRPNSELHIVHVVREDGAAESGGDLESLERRLARAPVALERQVTRLQEILPARVTAHVRAGQPARSILQTAVDVDADLIVIGTHQRNRIEAIINGSVVERVLRDAHCPVLVAVPKNYDGASKSESIEPPCPDCVVARQQSHNQTFWCERHSRAYNQPHVYEPTDRGRAVAFMPGH
jgi:nucleotide-binding universal stress UspA family protein